MAEEIKQKDNIAESGSTIFDEDEKMHIHFVDEKLEEGL